MSRHAKVPELHHNSGMTAKTKPRDLGQWIQHIMAGGGGRPGRPEPGDGGLGSPPPAPPFAPTDYLFSLDQIQILNTRSRHVDTVKVSMSVGVGNQAVRTTPTKDMGDLNNGTHPADLTLGPVHIDDPNVGIAFNYIVLNSGHQQSEATDTLLMESGSKLAAAGAQAATVAIGSAIGLQIGTEVMPVIGSILGLAAGWLVGQITGLLTANCDGPVALEQLALKGSELWLRTLHGPWSQSTYHPGLDSPHGCGSNSIYVTYWTIRRQ